MKGPAFILQHYFFTEMSVKANPGFQEGGAMNGTHIKSQINISRDSENPTFAHAQVRTFSENEKGDNQPYFFDFTVYAHLKHAEEGPFPDSDPSVRLMISQLLIGATREAIAAATGRGPWPHFVLPVISVSDAVLNHRPYADSRQEVEKKPLVTKKEIKIKRQLKPNK